MKNKRIKSTKNKAPEGDEHSPATTRNWKVINASPGALYRAFTDAYALAAWLAPRNDGQGL